MKWRPITEAPMAEKWVLVKAQYIASGRVFYDATKWSGSHDLNDYSPNSHVAVTWAYIEDEE